MSREKENAPLADADGLVSRLRVKARNCRDNAKADLAIRDFFIEEYRAGISLPESSPTPEKHARSLSLYDFTIRGEHRAKAFIEDAELYEAAADSLDRRSGGGRVRGLDWVDVSSRIEDAASVAGVYRVKYYDGHWASFLFGTGFTAERATIEEAKAAAQADYTSRILSALEPGLEPVAGTGEADIDRDVREFKEWIRRGCKPFEVKALELYRPGIYAFVDRLIEHASPARAIVGEEGVRDLQAAAQAVYDWWRKDVQDDSPELHTLFETLGSVLADTQPQTPSRDEGERG